ncbi:MAG: DNA polymerase III subunit gamma/tau [Chloroflexi bacterium]|nr:DNA polymerase III subunit gamma/tau [Chloroflexota bacterium]
MNAQVYYRKWRPRRFDDLVGQEAVARTLKQAVARNRIAHAYLFCGPRGTGKTSTARILAKAANCLAPQEGEPCNQCSPCMAVNDGRALDLVEIDAASNRRIEEMRDLREKVHYSPSEGRFKVYVLDEVHMLTNEAEAALLKTLEEPPPHVMFILATTDPQKLNETIVSRCQRFDFKRISIEATAQNLARVCEAEGIQADLAALRAIARNADGSMRDAEGLLEQAATSFGSPLTLDQVRLLLGLADDERIRQLVDQTLEGQTPQALATLSAIASEGVSLRQLHRQMVDEVRDILLAKAGGKQSPDGDAGPRRLLQSVSMERLLLTLRQLGQVVFRPDAPPTLALELAIIESAQDAAPSPQAVAPAHAEAPPQQRLAEAHPAAATSAARPPAAPVRQERPPTSPSQAVPTAARPRPVAPANATPEPLPEGMPMAERLERRWDEIIKALERKKGRRFYLGPLLRACKQHRMEGDTLYLEFTHTSHTERMREEMDTPEGKRLLIEALAKAIGVTTPLKVEIIAPTTPQRMDKASRSPLVQAAISMGGRIIEEIEEKDYDE